MPTARSKGGARRVPGVYVALQAKVIRQYEAAVGMQESYGYKVSQVAAERYRAAVAGEPIRVQGRNLRGHSMPPSPLRREQALDQFVVAADDRIEPAY